MWLEHGLYWINGIIRCTGYYYLFVCLFGYLNCTGKLFSLYKINDIIRCPVIIYCLVVCLFIYLNYTGKLYKINGMVTNMVTTVINPVVHSKKITRLQIFPQSWSKTESNMA